MMGMTAPGRRSRRCQMQRSSERILTTHAGSLPRPPDLLDMLDAVQADRARLGGALSGGGSGEAGGVVEAFLPAASPGCSVQIMATTHYPSRRDYLFALADALREEYRAIVAAGYVLQVDCPDLAMGR